jgi:hypothetical protein
MAPFIRCLALLAFGAFYSAAFPAAPAAPAASPATSAESLQSRSYQKMRGRRLRRFEASAGASQWGNPIEIELPADCIRAPKLVALNKSRHWATFVHRGVRYHLRRDNPHFTQTLRKLDKRKGKAAKLRWRGRVRHVRIQGKRVLSVRLDELRLQAGPKPRSRRAIRPWSVPTRNTPHSLRAKRDSPTDGAWDTSASCGSSGAEVRARSMRPTMNVFSDGSP